MFLFNEDYILKNEIAELRPLELSDEAELFVQSNDQEIWKHFTENGFGKQNFKNYIKRAIENRNDQQQYPFVIKDLRTNQLAGLTRIYEVNNALKNVKIGHTWIGKKFQATGLNKSCKNLLFEFLFEQMNFERIGFGASSLNKRSIKAMQKVGCTIEGELRNFLPTNNPNLRANLVLLSILKDEWLYHSGQLSKKNYD